MYMSNVANLQQIITCCYLYTMHTMGSAFYELRGRLIPLYDEREASAIAHRVLEHITGLGKLDRLVEKEMPLTREQQELFEEMGARLADGEPVQYVTGEAWFLGEKYLVDASVLIPRPETEELVQWIINDWEQQPAISILDVGSGSGCIPISLAKGLTQARVTSCDVSVAAIDVASHNAELLGAAVEFVQVDFLDPEARSWLGTHNVIVSNPPYIPHAEEERLHINVRGYEPSLALFVPDNDPLVFYRAIADFGRQHLLSGGAIYCELDADYAEETAEMFRQVGYSNTQLRKDMHDNPRMLCARF